jgi:hypothetical protein
MPQREDRIRSGLSPEALNKILIEDYHYDLFDFALSLASVLRKSPPYRIWNTWLIRKLNIQDYSILVRELDRLVKIKCRLTNDLKNHLAMLGRITNPIFPKEITLGTAGFNRYNEAGKSFIVDSVYKIDDTLGNEIDILKRIKNIFRRTKGSPAASRNVIAGLWSLVMRDTRRIHIEEIGNLIDWFYQKPEGTSYQEEINPPPSLADISRFISRKFRPLLEEDCKEIFVIRYPIRETFIKPYPFQVHFRFDEPEFLVPVREIEMISPILIFSNNIVLENPFMNS